MAKNKSKKIQKPAVPVAKKNLWPAMILFAFGFFLYSNTFHHDYVLDDSGAITLNAFVQKGFKGIPDLMKVEFWHFNNLSLGYYRPLSLITFAIEHEYFGNKYFQNNRTKQMLRPERFKPDEICVCHRWSR